MFSTIEDAIADIRAGKIVIVLDDENRENEDDFVASAEMVTPEMINFMATEGRGLICTPITRELAKDLSLSPMTTETTDSLETAFTVTVDYKTTDTGISAYERALTIQKMMETEVTAADFTRPGHVFPLVAKDNGVLERKGHTEAAVDLAKLAGVQPAGVICEIMKDDGTMARRPDLERFAEQFDLKMITIDDLITYREQDATIVEKAADTNLPTSFGDFQAIVYRGENNSDETIALVKGEVKGKDNVLVRVHSECLTGDVFGSKRCDCQQQLHASLEKISNAGSGVLLYMRQEGRGIGLVNKLKAYALQEKGYDTVEANQVLGYEADERDYDVAANIIQDLGIESLRLLTNNPQKMEGLTKNGIHISERVPLEIPAKTENARYLTTKKEKMGHWLTEMRREKA